MKIIIFLLTILLASYLLTVNAAKADAQMMTPMGGNVSQEVYDHTA